MAVAAHYHNVLADSRRWESVPLRPGDVVICTPPKSGTTWMQHLCALLQFDGRPPAPAPQLSPWVDQLVEPIEAVVQRIESQDHRRFLKTHTPIDGIPWDPRLTYLIVGRDPRDVAFSLKNHVANLNVPTVLGRIARATGSAPTLPPVATGAVSLEGMDWFWRWVDSDADPSTDSASLKSHLHHLRLAWGRRDEPNVALFHYADLLHDLPGEMARLAAVLGLALRPDRIDQLAGEASFEQMRARADELAPSSDHGHWLDNARFFDQGPERRWQHALSAEDLDRYERRLAALEADPEFSNWLHRN